MNNAHTPEHELNNILTEMFSAPCFIQVNEKYKNYFFHKTLDFVVNELLDAGNLAKLINAPNINGFDTNSFYKFQHLLPSIASRKSFKNGELFISSSINEKVNNKYVINFGSIPNMDVLDFYFLEKECYYIELWADSLIINKYIETNLFGDGTFVKT